MFAQAYHELKDRQQKEINEFPMAFAFNDKQLVEAMRKLHAIPRDLCSVMGIGDIVRKRDANKLKNMLLRHRDEIYIFLTSDKQNAYEAFRYEMDNHEYAINWSGDEDVLGCFNLTEELLEEFGLSSIYNKARRDYLKSVEDWI